LRFEGETITGLHHVEMYLAAGAAADTARLVIQDQTYGLVLQAYTDATSKTYLEYNSAHELAIQDLAGNKIIRMAGNDLAFHGRTPTSRGIVTGSRAGNAALASLLTALDLKGLIHDQTVV
jgi:hypothetical protein